MLPEFHWVAVDARPYIYTYFGLTQVDGKQEKLKSSKRAISLKDEVGIEDIAGVYLKPRSAPGCSKPDYANREF